MKTRRKFLATAPLAGAGALVTCAADASGGVSGAADAGDAGARSLLVRVTAAWNAGDGAAVGAPFREDGMLISADGTSMSGRKDISAYITRLLTGSMRGSQLAAKVEACRAMGERLAILRANIRFDLVDAPSRRAVMSLVAVRSEVWGIGLLQSTRLPSHKG